MSGALGAEKGERTAARLGYHSGYYDRTLVSRVGKLELRCRRDRHGRFSTELFERYQRSEKALVAAPAEKYVQGISTHKSLPSGWARGSSASTEELCGHSFSAAAISAINAKLDEGLAEFARRRLDEGLSVPDPGCPWSPSSGGLRPTRGSACAKPGWSAARRCCRRSGSTGMGRRSILAVELANRERRSSWRDFLLLGLRERGLSGVEFVVSYDPPGSARRLPATAHHRPHAPHLKKILEHYSGASGSSPSQGNLSTTGGRGLKYCSLTSTISN
jgi:putative transposase